MSDIFDMVLTTAGKTAIAAADGAGLAITFSQIAFGTGLYNVRDGGGVPLAAALDRTALVNEVERIALTAAAPNGDRQVNLVATLEGGTVFAVGEVGIFLDDGTLFAVASRASAPFFERGASETAMEFILSWDAADAASVDITTNGDAAIALLSVNVANLQAEMATKYDKAGGTISGNVIIEGDLTVNGTKTEVNTTQLNVGDNIIQLNSDHPDASAPVADAGFEVKRGTAPNASVLWIEDEDLWRASGPLDVLGTVFGTGLDISGVSVLRNKLLVGTGVLDQGWIASLRGASVVHGDARFTMALADSSAVAAGVGAGIGFLAENGSGTSAYTGGIWAERANGTAGNNEADLVLGARAHGVVVEEAMRIKGATKEAAFAGLVTSVGGYVISNTATYGMLDPAGNLRGILGFGPTTMWNGTGGTNVWIRNPAGGKVFIGVTYPMVEFDPTDGASIFQGKMIVNGGAKISVQNKVDGGSGQGIFLYDTDDTTTGIYLATAGAGKALNDGASCASLDGRTNYHTRFRHEKTAQEGFIWENSLNECLMSLTADTGILYTLGGFYTLGKLTVNGGTKLVVQNNVDGGSDYGILLWNKNDTNWGIYMASSGANKSLSGGNACTSIDGRTGHHHRYRANNTNTQGFIWENAAEQCLMSLTAETGDLFVKRNITAQLVRSKANRIATGNTAATATDYRIFIKRAVGAPTAVTLPAGADGLEFIIKDAKGDAATNPITITGTGGELIDGKATAVIKRNYQSVTLVWVSGAWYIV